jgi:hypothetical protein
VLERELTEEWLALAADISGAHTLRAALNSIRPVLSDGRVPWRLLGSFPDLGFEQCPHGPGFALGLIVPFVSEQAPVG